MHTPTTTLVFMAALMACGATVFAQPDGAGLNTDAKPMPANAANTSPGSEIFQAARDAVQMAKAVSYRVKYYGTGGMTGYTGTIQADVRMLRDTRPGGPNNGWLMRVTGSGKQRANAEALEFDVAWLTGSGVEWVDHSARKVFERRNSREARSPAYQIAVSPRLKELFEARPFSRELDPATQYTIEGEQEYDGVLCDVVLVQAQGRGRARWAIARTDGLPRRYESIVENSMMSGSTVMELSAVVVEQGDAARTTPAIVRVDVPDGYEEDRPARPAPVVNPAQDGEADAKLRAPSKDEDGMSTGGDEKGEALNVEGGVQSGDTAAGSVAVPTPPVIPRATRDQSRAGEDFVLKASDGSEVSLVALRGNVVLLEFSGSWCLPCRDSHPEIDALAEEMRGKPFRAFAVSCRDRSTESAIEKFREKNRSFGLLVKGDAVAETWGVGNYPTYFLIGTQGEVLAVKRNYEKGVTIGLLKEIALSHIEGETSRATVGSAGER